ncbi:uncharacterized protein LOC142556249 [Primulina tabacum]|uniref:uncharacterized protein LOC142556249 n=1 Tax=Primulina tabacum TaxID=48773 RepID=UPI003F5A8C74
MDGQDHKKPITSAVSEVHGVHLCHRCGWSFPNPHPSAKHRRAHKRVCGKMEGYKISPSDLAISDDSDEGDQCTPCPKIEKSNVKESNSDGGVHLRSNKSEDDVFSDAATEFSYSGISPSLEERLEVIKGDDKKIEQKIEEGDINVNLSKKVDECAGEVDVDPRQLEILSETESGVLEFKDVEFMRSRQGFEAGNFTGLDTGLNLDFPDVFGVKSVGGADVDHVVDESNRDGDVVFPEKTKEQPISKVSTNPFSESLVSAENYATNNSLTNDVQKPSEFFDVVHEDTEQRHDNGALILPENSDSSPIKVQETSPVKEKRLLETDSDKYHATEDWHTGIVETPDKISNEDSSNADKKVSDGENATVVDSKSLQDEGYIKDKLINEKVSVSAADSLEGKWGSISAVETNPQSSPRPETNMQNSERRNIKVHQSKSDDFEPPSFMTLVQPGKAPESVAAPTASEIEPVQHNQQQKSESLQAGWFPSLTNVVNDSQGRKKNEEIIAKVTNWNVNKEHRGQLKNLLNEAKSPNTKQQKDETSQKDNGATGTTMSSVVEPEEPKLEIPYKEDWNSPARYPTVIKKEKKKGKPYWVPFVCCSSVNRDL